jgi:ribonuclease-3 family protein
MEEYIENIDIQTISMQTLAFIGDSVYDVYIRTYLASRSNEKSGKLHKRAVSYVSARSQAKIVDQLIEFFNDEELKIYKRGRNTNISTNKHVDIIEYKKATGFEALIGYIYLSKNKKRLEEILKKSIEIVEEFYE